MTKNFKQYLSIMKKYPEAIFLFRVDDYYTAINDDAVTVVKHTGIPLEDKKSKRDAKAVAKVPLTYIESAMRILIKAGYKVALCDPLESPQKAKGVSNWDVNK